MATFLEHAYSLVHQDNTADQPTLQELRTQLEKGTDETKVETMKRVLTIMLNGDSMPNLLMHIIRFVMPSKSKPLKKLLYFYYEICPKLDSVGKLKQEMILVWYGNVVPIGGEYTRLKYIIAMVSETIFSIRMSTYVEIPSASCASSGNLNLLNLYYPLPDRASSIVMPMCARMRYSLFLQSINFRKRSYQTPLNSYSRF